MRDGKWIKPADDLHGAGSRRVLEALKLVSEEMTDWDDDDLPEMPAGVLMNKERPDGGRAQW
jgi:hypothetical protein